MPSLNPWNLDDVFYQFTCILQWQSWFSKRSITSGIMLGWMRSPSSDKDSHEADAEERELCKPFMLKKIYFLCVWHTSVFLTLFKTRSNGYFSWRLSYRVECVNVLTYTKQTMCWALGTPPMGQRSKSLRPWPVDSMREYIEKKR